MYNPQGYKYRTARGMGSYIKRQKQNNCIQKLKNSTLRSNFQEVKKVSIDTFLF